MTPYLKQLFTRFVTQMKTSKITDGVMHLIYPCTCIICETELSRSEPIVCSKCETNIHYTHFENYTEPTSLDQLFWGRVSLNATYALVYYKKTNSSQDLLKALKYQRRSEVGTVFGRKIGAQLLTIDKFSTVDALIPVPIHPKKLAIRGYNQSEMLANGISEIMNVKVEREFIIRNEHSKSQTTLGRFNRWDNVDGKFSIVQSTPLKHIALVDDVITTGSTLESIIRSIQEKFPDIQISVISLAVTN